MMHHQSIYDVLPMNSVHNTDITVTKASSMSYELFNLQQTEGSSYCLL